MMMYLYSGVLYSDDQGWNYCCIQQMDQFHKSNVEYKEPAQKTCDWFHLYKVQKQAEWIYGVN